MLWSVDRNRLVGEAGESLLSSSPWGPTFTPGWLLPSARRESAGAGRLLPDLSLAAGLAGRTRPDPGRNPSQRPARGEIGCPYIWAGRRLYPQIWRLVVWLAGPAEFFNIPKS